MGRRKKAVARAIELIGPDSREAMYGERELRTRQELRMIDRLDAIDAKELRGDTLKRQRGVVTHVLSWYALPFEWRDPKTEAGLAADLAVRFGAEVTVKRLALICSMYGDVLDAMRGEIRRAMTEYGQLSSIEVMAGVKDSAKINAPMFDRWAKVAWSEEPPTPFVQINNQNNVAVVVDDAEDAKALLLEKLGQ